MRKAVSGALMVLAMRSLGRRRREWGRAMLGEFDAANAAGNGLGFAAGCLAAAVRQMPQSDEGRLAISYHIVALGLLVPLAVLLFSSVLTGFPNSYLDPSALYGLPPPSGSQGPLLNAANLSAVPPLAGLVILLSAVKLWSAWLVLARDWARLANAAALSSGATVTTLFFTAVVFADQSAAAVQVGAWAVEIGALVVLARWQAELSSAS